MKKKLILRKEVIASLSNLERSREKVVAQSPTTVDTPPDTADTCNTCIPYSLDACRTIGCII